MAEIEKMKRTEMSAAEPQNAVGNPNQAAQPQNAIGSPSARDKSPNLMQQHQQQRLERFNTDVAQVEQRRNEAAQRTNAAANPDQAAALQNAQQELAAKQQALPSMQTTPAAGQAQAAVSRQYQAAQPQQRALTPPVMGFAPDTPSPNRATSEELYGPRSLSQSQSISYRETSGGGKPLERVDTWEMERNLKEANEAAKKQQTAAIDQATRANAEQLRIAEREAQAQYDEQRRQTSLDERQAMDNSALYAAARGDRGGVGQAQYNAIQANAARNRASIGQAQTKLSSDVTRQIAELRRQGEFKKADALLTLSQQYLSQLNDLKRWATETNIGIDQANNALAQWEKSYAIDLAGVTGELNGVQTLDAKKIGADIAYQQGSLALDQAIHEHDKEQDAIKNAYNDRSLDAEIAHNEATLALDQAIHEHDKEQDAIKNAYNDRSLDAEIAHNQASLALDQAIQDYNKGQDYLDRSQDQRELDANNGWTLLQASQMPNATQLKAMGWTSGQAQKYINDAKALKAATDAASAAGDTSKVANLGWKSLGAGIMPSKEQLSAMGITSASAQAYIDRILKEESSASTTPQDTKPTTTAPTTPNREIFAVQVPTAAFAEVNGKKRYVGNVGLKVK